MPCMAGQIEVFLDSPARWRWRIVTDLRELVRTSDDVFPNEEEARHAAVEAMASNPFLPPLPETRPGPTPQGGP